MLSSLDSEVIFKKAFTDKFVFTRFVKDVTGIDIEVDKIETEKKFDKEIGYIDFKFDIFAESRDKRIIVEIQKVEYDHNFDRFLHYFLSSIIEQQKSSKKYKIKRKVYTIVVLTAPYNMKTIDGEWVQDEVLLSKLDPKTIMGHERKVFGHELYFLNHNYKSEGVKPEIRDWLTLIYESINNPEDAHVNTNNEGIKKATELIDDDNLTNEERTMMKNDEGRKVVLKIQEDIGIAKGKIEGKLENTKETIKKLLIKRFKILTPQIKSKIDECNDNLVFDNIIEAIFEVDSLDQILEFFK
ncbi:MAG: PD-(D/E)XK nuclease family transposase [Candidatus Sericytochromatia bacterium]|nr:PD-(D/E)XK nuclease family transposase [Candidatus Sericytochromatia bacterium]